MIRTDHPSLDDRTTETTADHLEKVADRHNVGVSHVGAYLYAVVTQPDGVWIWRARVPAGEAVA